METNLVIKLLQREYYEKVVISHETYVARSPQQNGVIERRNRTLIKAARTMLIYAKAPLFLWAEAVATVCYTQNCSIISLHHGKTPYELLQDKLPDLSFFHVFGTLCCPTNDSENLEKLQPKADIGIFIGYATNKIKLFRNLQPIVQDESIETIHVVLMELTTMAFEHSSSGLALHEMTPATISSRLVPNPPPSKLVDHPTPKVIAPIAEVVAPEPVASTGSPSSTTVDQDAPLPRGILRARLVWLLVVTSRKEDIDFEESLDPVARLDVITNFLRIYADHAGCQDTRRSTSGSMQLLGDRLVSFHTHCPK
ncbi:retrovirus-related pol polyprotein from transposon TNT 1-94 [Tanacetum coccineum]